MKIRSFKGYSLERIYETIHKEMGTEAVVVSTRKPEGIKAVLPPFMGREPYELIAVVDDDNGERHMLSQALGSEAMRKMQSVHSERMKSMEESFQKLQKELHSASQKGFFGTDSGGSEVPEVARGWDPRFVRQIERRCPDFFVSASRDEQLQALEAVIPVEERFPVKGTAGRAEPEAGGRPHIVVFVGPTGSGKTTTLAKLAARWSMNDKLRVGIITTDTFRVAAVDQIKEYSSLLGIELRVVFSAAEAGKAVKSFDNKDVIVVDTAGRSHYDQVGLSALRGVLQGMGRVTVLMMVPATWDRAGLAEMIKNFQILKPNYLVVTKTDETRRFDSVTVMASECACPVAFMTNGQRVPQDITAASARELAGMLLPAEEMV